MIYVKPGTSFDTSLSFSGDKSISHRLVLASLFTRGQLVLGNLSDCADVKTSLEIVKQLGVEQSLNEGLICLNANDPTPERHGNVINLDCGNSGTTARLLCGILASRPGEYQLTGDKSLSSRPMQRVVEPLQQMGAMISASDGGLPIKIRGQKSLTGQDFCNKIASAQVKSAQMFAALHAAGISKISEPFQSRDHSERLLKAVKARIDWSETSISIHGNQKLSGNFRFDIPGDLSSAAFFIGAAVIAPNRRLKLTNILLNPLRTGFIEVLKRMGASIKCHITASDWEPRGHISVSGGIRLKAVEIGAAEIVSLIDELPLLAMVMCFAQGTSRVRGASELRHKETDRISALIRGLKACGVKCVEYEDGFDIEGPANLDRLATIDSEGDHRLAMSFAVLATASKRGLNITNPESVRVSFPHFFTTLMQKCSASESPLNLRYR